MLIIGEAFLFVLGFDFGVNYVGVAVGQFLTCSASPLFSIFVKENYIRNYYIASILEFWSPQCIVIGYPISDLYDNSFLLDKIDNFAFDLRLSFLIPVIFVNENLSTWQARRVFLIDRNKNDRTVFFSVNACSAVILVEQWLFDQSVMQ